ncbi:MAG: hypothetical protein V3V21_01285, partial [Thermoplasmata archaeon]
SFWLAERASPSKHAISLISLFNLRSYQDVGSAKAVNEKMEANTGPRKARSKSISICQVDTVNAGFEAGITGRCSVERV